MESFLLEIHHGGQWSTKWDNDRRGIEYLGGEVSLFYPDIEKLSFSYLQSFADKLGYQRGCKMWFKIRGLSDLIAYEEILSDENVENTKIYHIGDKKIKIYFVEYSSPTRMLSLNSDEEPMLLGLNSEPSSSALSEGTGVNVEDKYDGGMDTNSLEHCNISDMEVSVEDFEGKWSTYDEYVGDLEDTYVEIENELINDLFIDKLTEEDMVEFNVSADIIDDDFNSLEGSDDEGLPKNMYYNDVTGELATGMLFTGVKDFFEALRRWAIERKTSHVFIKNCKTVVVAHCREKCGFKIRASKLRDSNTFQIKTLVPNHTCPRSMTNHLVNSKYLASKYLDDIKDNPMWKVDAMKNKVQRDLEANVSKMKCYRAKTRAKKMLQGEVDAQYHRLWDYGATIMKNNPGSFVKLKTNLVLLEPNTNEFGSQPRVPRDKLVFQFMYVRFAPQKMGYFAGLRPIVCLDGCHLKTNMGGHLLSAVGRDGNENFYPLAMACVDSECKELWRWFIQTMFDDFGSPSETSWVFMSDQQKGLIEALKELAPDMEHRFCVKHMYENYKKLFKGKEYKDFLWGAASSSTEKRFLKVMIQLREFDIKAYEWAMNHNPRTWARCYFSTRTKCDVVYNNISESFNASVAEARELPILSMFEKIRRSLMKRQYVRLVGMRKYNGPICPRYQKELEKIKFESRNCFCTHAADDIYEVWCGGKQVDVNLEEKSCTCRMWQLSGVPCKHAVAAIYSNREQPENYVDRYYSKETYLAVYSALYKPVPSQDEWEKTDFTNIQPWIVKKQPGRPKKRRIKASDEPVNPYKSSRAGIRKLCGKCKKEGHNSRTCDSSMTGETPWQTRKRKEAEKNRAQDATTHNSRGKSNASTSKRRTNTSCSSARHRGTSAEGNVEERAMTFICVNQPHTMPHTSTAQLEKKVGKRPMSNAFATLRDASLGGAPEVMSPLPFRPPRPPPPNYAAETVSAASKKRQPNTFSSIGRFKNPARVATLESLAKRKGNILKRPSK